MIKSKYSYFTCLKFLINLKNELDPQIDILNSIGKMLEVISLDLIFRRYLKYKYQP